MKKLLTLLFTGMIVFSLAMPVFAQETTQETTKATKAKKTKATKTKKTKAAKTTTAAPTQ
jgi:hypothetical protein